jgi:PhnB protein
MARTGRSVITELKIGDSVVMISDETPQSGARSPRSLGGTTVGLFLYVPDVDSTFGQAVSAGGKSEVPVADMFWGDRYGKLTDPFGHFWSLATHKEDLSLEEMKKRTKQAMEKMAQPNRRERSERSVPRESFYAPDSVPRV